MSSTLTDKTALVTGASSGIGSACARALADRGARVFVTGRNPDALDALAGELGGQAIVADLRSEPNIERLFSELGDRLDILVNSAGVAPKAPVLDADPSLFRELLDVNVFALTRCCQLALQKFPDSGGHIVNLSSMSGHRVPPGGGFYAATKHTVRAVTEALRHELKAAGSKTRVAILSPGFVDTPLLNRYFTGSEEKLEDLKAGLRMLDPRDVAAALLHILESPDHVEVGDIQLRPREQRS